jgi:hypothetical protein
MRHPSGQHYKSAYDWSRILGKVLKYDAGKLTSRPTALGLGLGSVGLAGAADASINANTGVTYNIGGLSKLWGGGEHFDPGSYGDFIKNLVANVSGLALKNKTLRAGIPLTAYGFSLGASGNRSLKYLGQAQETSGKMVADALESAGGLIGSGRAGSGTSGEGTQQWLGPLLATLGIGTALGGGAYMLQKAVRDKADAPINITTTEGGRLKVRLPTKNPNDAETIVDLPYNPEEQLSDALRRRISIDTKRRLRAETQSRVHRLGTSLDQQVR